MASERSTELNEIYRTLITANHIIHHQSVVDAYGHISARHPHDASIFIMSGSMAPGTVSEASDLIHYWVKDSSPVDPNAKKGFQERFIHSELYRRFPGVHSVVHSHSENVLPFAMGGAGVQMKPCFHIAGFIGNNVPNYDITEFYPQEAVQDMLVNTEDLGRALAVKFSHSPSNSCDVPHHNVVVMQNHGFTTLGKSIQQATFRAVYTHVNAGLQTKAITVHAALGKVQDIKYLDEKQIKGCTIMGENTQGRPWGLWAKEVAANAFYVNRG